jgi:hypothetical protein
VITVRADQVRPGDVLDAAVHFVTPEGTTTADTVTVLSAVAQPGGLVRVIVGADLDGPLKAFDAWQDFAPDAEVELRERGAS